MIKCILEWEYGLEGINVGAFEIYHKMGVKNMSHAQDGIYNLDCLSLVKSEHSGLFSSAFSMHYVFTQSCKIELEPETKGPK